MKILKHSLVVGFMLFECLNTAWAASWSDWSNQQQINKNQQLEWQNQQDIGTRAGEWNAEHSGKKNTENSGKKNAGTVHDLEPIVMDAVLGPGAPKSHISAKDYPITNFRLEVCVPLPVVQKASWANPQSARALALRAAIRRFIRSHRFRDAGSVAEETVTTRIIRVTETADRFRLEEVRDCHDSYFNMGAEVVVSGAAPPKPAPAPSPQSPTPNNDIDPNNDPFGPGGIISPQ